MYTGPALDRDLQRRVAARKVSGPKAAAPHSGGQVWAAGAFLTPEGIQHIIVGSNAESGLRPLSLCAEPAVMVEALQETGPTARLQALAILGLDPSLPPCSCCCQAIHDVSRGTASVSFLRKGAWVTRPISDLFPDAPDHTAASADIRGGTALLREAAFLHAELGLPSTQMLALVRTESGAIFRGTAIDVPGWPSASAVSAAVWKATNKQGASLRITDVASYAEVRCSGPDGRARGLLDEHGPAASVAYMRDGLARARTLRELVPEQRVKRLAMSAPQLGDLQAS